MCGCVCSGSHMFCGIKSAVRITDKWGCDNHLTVCANTKSVYFIPETNTVLHYLKKRMELSMKPCTGGPTGAWWARGPCCNIMSELGLSPWQFPWSVTLTAAAEVLKSTWDPTQGVRGPLQAACHPLPSVSILQPHSNPAYSWNWHLKVAAQSAALTGSLYTASTLGPKIPG